MSILTSPALRCPRRVTPELHFTGGATSNVNLGTIHDSENKLWISLWFKLDSEWSSAAPADKYLLSKHDGTGDLLRMQFSSASGTLYAQHREASGAYEGINTTKTSWSADTWYHVLASFSTVNGIRLIIDGGTPTTDTDGQTAISLTADFIIGSQTDGATNGVIGEIRDFAMGTKDLSTTEERDLCKGIIPADATEFYRLNEGHGTTAFDLGTGGNDGTIDSANTWETGLRHYVRYG